MAIDISALSRRTAMTAAVGLAAVAVTGFLITLVHASGPGVAQAQDTQQNADKAEAETPMSRCMATWDRATQMSKEEWRETCKRTIKEDPGLYNKSF